MAKLFASEMDVRQTETGGTAPMGDPSGTSGDHSRSVCTGMPRLRKFIRGDLGSDEDGHRRRPCCDILETVYR